MKKETNSIIKGSKTSPNQYRNEQAAYVLDQKELNELLSVNVYKLAENSPKKTTNGIRKGSDEDVYVEETLFFLYNPNHSLEEGANLNGSPKRLSNTPQISVTDLRKYFIVEVHKLDEDNELEYEYGQIQNGNIMNGEFIENDIRLSETIRESIDEIKQLHRLAHNKSGELERRKFSQNYMETAELLGVSLTVEHLLPALNEISEITVGYNGIRDYIMPFFYEFFQNSRIDENLKQDIQADVIGLLVKVSQIMTNEDRADKVLPIILENDSDEEKRILGLELVDKLAEYIGKDNCQNFLMYEIVSLQDDPIYRVRKETVMRMINISKVLGKEIFLGILFPVFKKLANDQIWGVRRSAVEVLPQISNLCPIEIKNGILIEMFKKFSQDSSKWVKMATFQYLGPFIATYEGIEPNPILIDYYINMCEQNKSSQADNEVPYHCAYNFPAVLQTLGSKAWPRLQPVHNQLVKDSRWKVRRTLAFSLHEIAKILGPKITEKELIPVLYIFLKDVNEVKEGVTMTLPKFIKVLSPEQRENYIDKFAETKIDNQDWRKRIAQAKQVKSFSKIFSAQTVHKYYVPVFFQLCQDQVAEVRLVASKAVRNICLKLKENEELFHDFVTKVIFFKESNKYNLRQTFLSMCETLMQSRDLFIEHFLSHFCDLSQDKVINVRMALCEVILKHFQNEPNGGLIQELKSLRLLVKTLSSDKCRDVGETLEELSIQYSEDDFLETSINESLESSKQNTSKQIFEVAEEIEIPSFVKEQEFETKDIIKGGSDQKFENEEEKTHQDLENNIDIQDNEQMNKEEVILQNVQLSITQDRDHNLSEIDIKEILNGLINNITSQDI